MQQAARLEDIVADAAALIKETGRFYDLYSETHRAAQCTLATSTAPAIAHAVGSQDGHVGGVTVSGKYTSRCTATSHGLDGVKNGINRFTATPAGSRSSGGVSEEGAGVGKRFFVVSKELDKRCYDLLESNARLCLRLQSLGLEYSSLRREITSLTSSGGEQEQVRSGKEWLGGGER